MSPEDLTHSQPPEPSHIEGKPTDDEDEPWLPLRFRTKPARIEHSNTAWTPMDQLKDMEGQSYSFSNLLVEYLEDFNYWKPNLTILSLFAGNLNEIWYIGNYLAKRQIAARLIAVDKEKPTHNRAADLPASHQAELVIQDAFEFLRQQPPASLDVVTLYSADQYFYSGRLDIRELKRLLIEKIKPGGMLHFTGFYDMTSDYFEKVALYLYRRTDIPAPDSEKAPSSLAGAAIPKRGIAESLPK